jgi:proteasome assembly chaperone (PAC2) family protein
MDKEINGHLYIANDNLKIIADALEEIIRLVKEDQEKMRKINEEPEKED